MRIVATVGICCVLFARVPGSIWTANGATACDKLLTADFLTTILVHTKGQSQPKPAGTSCLFTAEYDDGFNSMTIGLSDPVPLADWNRLMAANLPGGIPVPGVGDKAFRSKDAAILHAYTNKGRMCSVMLTALGESPKLAGDALAKKFGTLCNQLFALP